MNQNKTLSLHTRLLVHTVLFWVVWVGGDQSAPGDRLYPVASGRPFRKFSVIDSSLRPVQVLRASSFRIDSWERNLGGGRVGYIGIFGIFGFGARTRIRKLTWATL